MGWSDMANKADTDDTTQNDICPCGCGLSFAVLEQALLDGRGEDA